MVKKVVFDQNKMRHCSKVEQFSLCASFIIKITDNKAFYFIVTRYERIVKDNHNWKSKSCGQTVPNYQRSDNWGERRRKRRREGVIVRLTSFHVLESRRAPMAIIELEKKWVVLCQQCDLIWQKFTTLWHIVNKLWPFERVHLVLGKFLSLLWQKNYLLSGNYLLL